MKLSLTAWRMADSEAEIKAVIGDVASAVKSFVMSDTRKVIKKVFNGEVVRADNHFIEIFARVATPTVPLEKARQSMLSWSNNYHGDDVVKTFKKLQVALVNDLKFSFVIKGDVAFTVKIPAKYARHQIYDLLVRKGVNFIHDGYIPVYQVDTPKIDLYDLHSDPSKLKGDNFRVWEVEINYSLVLTDQAREFLLSGKVLKEQVTPKTFKEATEPKKNYKRYSSNEVAKLMDQAGHKLLDLLEPKAVAAMKKIIPAAKLKLKRQMVSVDAQNSTHKLNTLNGLTNEIDFYQMGMTPARAAMKFRVTYVFHFPRAEAMTSEDLDQIDSELQKSGFWIVRFDPKPKTLFTMHSDPSKLAGGGNHDWVSLSIFHVRDVKNPELFDVLLGKQELKEAEVPEAPWAHKPRPFFSDTDAAELVELCKEKFKKIFKYKIPQYFDSKKIAISNIKFTFGTLQATLHGDQEHHTRHQLSVSQFAQRLHEGEHASVKIAGDVFFSFETKHKVIKEFSYGIATFMSKDQQIWVDYSEADRRVDLYSLHSDPKKLIGHENHVNIYKANFRGNLTVSTGDLSFMWADRKRGKK